MYIITYVLNVLKNILNPPPLILVPKIQGGWLRPPNFRYDLFDF